MHPQRGLVVNLAEKNREEFSNLKRGLHAVIRVLITTVVEEHPAIFQESDRFPRHYRFSRRGNPAKVNTKQTDAIDTFAEVLPLSHQPSQSARLRSFLE